MGRKTWLLLAIAVLGVVAAGVAFRGREAGPVLPRAMVAIHRAQQALPIDEVRAIQALRVVAAVEAVHFTRRSRYGTPKELKAAGLLDPAWPRVNPAAYRIRCRVGEAPMGFACFADPVSRRGSHYFVDPSQVVRWEKDRRPNEHSPIFGLSKEKP